MNGRITNAPTGSADEFSSGIADKNRLRNEPGGKFHRAPTTVSVGPGSPWQVALQQRLRPYPRAENRMPPQRQMSAEFQNQPNAPTGSRHHKSADDHLKSRAKPEKTNDKAARRNPIDNPFTCRF